MNQGQARREISGMLSQLALRVIVLLFLCPRSGAAAEFTFFEPVKPPRPQQVMAHRGESRQAPENTRVALQRCIDDALEWAEIDLRLTRDNQHILWHDSSVTDASGKSWTIKESSLA